MKKSLLLIGAVALSIACLSIVKAISIKSEPAMTPSEYKSVYDFTMKNIDGKDIKLSSYKGKVLLIVNVASRCGYTPQYEGLQKLYTTYKDKGLVILGFPANNFKEQEPGSNEEIKEFCSLKYGVSFPLFSKISVKGDDKHPLYKYLTENPENGGEITWNFNKFLVSKDGKVLAHFSQKDKPEDPKMAEAIEAALK